MNIREYWQVRAADRTPHPVRSAHVAPIAFGIFLIFVLIPGEALDYSMLGLVSFAGITMADFQRVRRSTHLDSAPFIATRDHPGRAERVPVLSADPRLQAGLRDRGGRGLAMSYGKEEA